MAAAAATSSERLLLSGPSSLIAGCDARTRFTASFIDGCSAARVLFTVPDDHTGAAAGALPA